MTFTAITLYLLGSGAVGVVLVRKENSSIALTAAGFVLALGIFALLLVFE